MKEPIHINPIGSSDGEREACREALRELVALRDLKASFYVAHEHGRGAEAQRIREEHNSREPIAWEAARAALSSDWQANAALASSAHIAQRSGEK